MLKKVSIPVVLALILALLFSSTALAAPEGPDDGRNRPRGGIGTVVSAAAGELVVDRRDGGRLVLAVDELTVLRELDGSLIELANLQAGDTVLVAAGKSDPQGWVARLVVRVPADFDPQAEHLGRRAHGEVTAVDAAAGTLSLRTPAGEELTFSSDAGTRYLGSIASLADVESGSRVFVMGMALPDGSLLALVIGQREPLDRYAGKIVDVDPSAKSFSLETRSGESVTFLVDENTRYKSRDDQLNTLANLKPNMLALVMAKPQEDGTLLAVLVAAADKPQIPEFDLKKAGKVTAVGTDSFTISTLHGEEFTFLVTDETRFVSRSRRVKGLAELQVGMRVGVGVQDLGNENYLALAVMAGRLPQP